MRPFAPPCETQQEVELGAEAIYRALDLRQVDLFVVHAAAGLRSSSLRKASANQKIHEIQKSVKSIRP